MKAIQLSLGVFALIVSPIRAQQLPADTVRIKLVDAERRFLNNNLQLLAAKFGVDAAKASIVQARLWNNPNLTVAQNVYNQYTGRYFDISSTGNTEVQVQQLFLLAGKRDKQVRLAAINSRIAENTFEDVLRTLKYRLRTDFYDLYFLDQSLAFYDESIVSLRRTVASTESVYEKRSVLLSELLRVKSLLFTLENERIGLVDQIVQRQEDLRVLFADSSRTRIEYIPEVDEHVLDNFRLDSLSVQTVIALALQNRPESKNAEENVKYEETNLELQQALSIPDVTVGGYWSRNGNYIPNYFALSLSVDLPLFNRNEGNIQVSENTLESNRRLRDSLRQSLEKDVVTAYRKAAELDYLFKSFDRKFTGEYKQLVEGVTANYEKRNISVIEFTDFFESYRTSMLQMNQLRNNRLDALEALNYAVGTNITNP